MSAKIASPKGWLATGLMLVTQWAVSETGFQGRHGHDPFTAYQPSTGLRANGIVIAIGYPRFRTMRMASHPT